MKKNKLRIDPYKLQLVMAEKRLTASALAVRCGFTKQYICMILREKYGASLVAIGTIADELHTPVCNIVYEREECGHAKG